MRLDLRRLRLDRGDSIRTVCAATGLPEATVRLWERQPSPVRPSDPSPRLAGLAALLAYYGLALAVVPADGSKG